MLRGGEIAEGGRRRADDLKPGKAFGKPAGRQRGHAGSPSDEEQAVSLAGRQGAKLEDQVRSRHSLWQSYRRCRAAQTRGAPSATMNAARALTSCRSGFSRVSIA